MQLRSDRSLTAICIVDQYVKKIKRSGLRFVCFFFFIYFFGGASGYDSIHILCFFSSDVEQWFCRLIDDNDDDGCGRLYE